MFRSFASTRSTRSDRVRQRDTCRRAAPPRVQDHIVSPGDLRDAARKLDLARQFGDGHTDVENGRRPLNGCAAKC